MKTIYEIGCYADGARGYAEQNDIVIGLVADLPEPRMNERMIVSEYRAYVQSLESDIAPNDEAAIHQAHQAIGEIIDRAVALLNTVTDQDNMDPESARPPYTYWGFIDGDFGLWPAVEDVNDAALNLSDVIIDYDAPRFILNVNDHGNMTLYAIERREVWSVV